MSEQILAQLEHDQKTMDRNASLVVIALTIISHIILNVYARMVEGDFLKIEIPIVTLVTAIVVGISLRMGKGKPH